MAVLGSFLLYTGFLIIISRRSDKKTIPIETFREGNRQLGAWTIFLMVTALWSSSLIVVEIDTAYRWGVAAIWYGISVGLMSLLVSILIPWFRRHHYVSNSDLLGQRFGGTVRRLSGIVIGITFPIFALSNALAAGAVVHVLLHWPLWVTLFITTAALVTYIQFAGMMSLAKTQGLNFAMVVTSLILAGIKLGQLVHHHHGSFLDSPRPAFWHLFGIGHGTIWVWFGMNILNVFSAQAEIQTVAASKTRLAAQRAIWLSTGVLILITIFSVWLGIQARVLMGHSNQEGLMAFFRLVLQHSSPGFDVIFSVGVWALALTWCGPLLFSGAISVGGDVINRSHSVRTLRWALVIEAVLMVLYTTMRPDNIAWWRVFGLTLRNAAVVGPTLAVILWDDLNPTTVIIAMIAGIGVGVGFNAWTDFSVTHFVWGINPMWSAATTSFIVLALSRLWTRRQYRSALGGMGLWLLFAILLIKTEHKIFSAGLTGLGLLVLGVSFMIFAWWRTRSSDPIDTTTHILEPEGH
ncbi:Na+/proline symporter [Sulfobacillus thermosulfidooxidans DSM 9293]|uniref:Na+/proline symporter n=1 Tax=Sulfobacillus thermosulfidooxidans (strain DSM 9293 / VKM B-1269 / AT-1) TaxID=929705 RepID=A0A1W1WMH2_SULTA|nr:hypothetical protein [Sulfobacillus thermosulfidooxidans]SMC06933.1 Na+/proline symporter [Sulfobacillus thermosulfidooxidans DSM 9293]